MLRYAQAEASLPGDGRDVRLRYCCQQEIQDSGNGSAFLSYNPKGAWRLQLHRDLYRECAATGSCLSIPRCSRQQEGQELGTGSQRQAFVFPSG